MLITEFDDPRTKPGFQPELFPTCNGKQCPPFDHKDREAVIMRSASAAYYSINHLLNRLLIAKQNSDAPAKQETLNKIKHANERRNRLADQLESEGLEIRPKLSGWKTIDLLLVETLVRDVDQDNQQQTEYFDMVIPISNPEDKQAKQ